ncbi:MAG TPA: hypothetical protein VND99_01755 [Candidatus Acidoferrales bacterium]|nr:hypothetical protein [Candidatus Acidoferrales bacterium]
MSDTAQDFQKLLTEAIRKQIIILGPQITLLKAHNVPGMTVSEDGTVIALSGNPSDVVTQFLEQFREISGPLLKKTMKPLLSTLSPNQPDSHSENSAISENQKTGSSASQINQNH